MTCTRAVSLRFFACQLTLLCVAIAVTGCGQEATYAPPPPPKVVVDQPVVEEVVVYAEMPGHIEAMQAVDVLARVRGFIQGIGYADGEFVEEGQVLFQIEPEQYEAVAAQAEAALASAQAELTLAESYLQKVSKAAAADAATAVEVLEAQAKKDGAEASVKSAEASLAGAKLDLGYTQVAAPFHGLASEAQVDVGDYVDGSARSVLTQVRSLDPIYVYCDASERGVLEFKNQGKQLPRSEGGDIPEDQRIAVKLRLSDGSVYPHEGYIDYVSPAIDAATGTLRMRVLIPNTDLNLFPGQFARVMIAKFKGEAVLVPEVAVMRDAVGPYLLSVDDKNVVARKDVKLGELLDERRIVLEGVTPDDRIVTVGVQRARLGLPVDPQAPSDAPTGQAERPQEPNATAAEEAPED